MTKSHQYMVDRYAQSLTKYDSMALLERAKKRTGSLAAATKEADITRKTVYDWENNTDDVKTLTKRKILEANLEADYFGTLEFLTRKAALNYKEILERYIKAMLDRIRESNETIEIQENISKFNKYLKANSGAISDLRTVRMDRLIKTINDKANLFDIDGVSEGIDFINSQVLSQKFMRLLEVICMKTMFKEDMADRLNLPKDFVEQACKVARYINPKSDSENDLEEQLTPKIAMPSRMGGINSDLPYSYSLRARRY